ncbi:uncharacterized protein VTP21DRAFT_610 [Calcarisporiella thermophila]|uniref:uncharacterized protein n=1 Tax=Calcarisporiella thermophila TaxID=911321 RepID=UPI0037436253
MAILPTTAPRTDAHSSFNNSRSRYGGRRRFHPEISTSTSTSILPLFLRRLFRFPHMDFEYALWQMAYLCLSPRRVYRNIYYHKQTKNQWSRDDPAFVVLLSGMLCISAVAWGLVYGHGFVGILRMMLYMVFVDFVIVGIIVATLSWLVSNHFLKQRVTSHSVDQEVEWQYAFDVHCNAFFPVFLILYVIQFFFMGLLLRRGWISLFVGNTMYLVAVIYYFYVTFLGYNALPFLVHTEMFLYPVIIFGILYLISLFGFNISANVLTLYFGS